jgi:hypothetical protein
LDLYDQNYRHTSNNSVKKNAKYNPSLTLPTRERIRLGLILSLVGRVRLGLLNSINKTLQFTIPCMNPLIYICRSVVLRIKIFQDYFVLIFLS